MQYGKVKIDALDWSVKKFVQVYEHIQEISLKEIREIDKIAKYIIDTQKVAQLREMFNFFQHTLTEDPAGNAAFVRFGAGTTSSLSILASSVVMPSVISIGATADENLEKAETMYEEAENAFVRMRMSKISCICISNQANMFYKFFVELEEMFSKCVDLLDGVVKNKVVPYKKTVLQSYDLTTAEKKFAAVTCAFAGIMKTMIDTPIISEDGTLPMEASDIYNDLRFNGFFQLSQMVQELERKLGQQEDDEDELTGLIACTN